MTTITLVSPPLHLGWGPGLAKKMPGTEEVSGGSLMSVTRGGERAGELNAVPHSGLGAVQIIHSAVERFGAVKVKHSVSPHSGHRASGFVALP